MDPELVQQWLRAASDPEVRGELEAVYADVAAQVEARGPACWASGRCCNFEKAGHLLYVTGLEAAYTVAGLRAWRGERAAAATRAEPGAGCAAPLAGASGSEGCRFQAGNLCTVHGIKPMGCRVYFCDASAQEWQQRLSEHGLKQIRGIHDRRRIEYRYGEWRMMLGALMRAE